jgi:hypothetical protein
VVLDDGDAGMRRHPSVPRLAVIAAEEVLREHDVVPFGAQRFPARAAVVGQVAVEGDRHVGRERLGDAHAEVRRDVQPAARAQVPQQGSERAAAGGEQLAAGGQPVVATGGQDSRIPVELRTDLRRRGVRHGLVGC